MQFFGGGLVLGKLEGGQMSVDEEVEFRWVRRAELCLAVVEISIFNIIDSKDDSFHDFSFIANLLNLLMIQLQIQRHINVIAFHHRIRLYL